MLDDAPLVSLIIPVYNVKSCLSQYLRFCRRIYSLRERHFPAERMFLHGVNAGEEFFRGRIW